MFIHLKDLATKGSIALEGAVDLTGDLPITGSLLSFGPLTVKLEAKDKSGAAEITGRLDIDVEQSCARCLKSVAQHVAVPFHETFVKGEEPGDTDEADDDEGAEDVLYVSGDRLELQPYFTEAVMLAMPFVPLCTEECQGLCPVCGTNRNEHACGCKQDKVDPRLAGLADFFKDQK